MQMQENLNLLGKTKEYNKNVLLYCTHKIKWLI